MPEKFIRSEIIAITGHRDYPDRAALLRGLDRLRAREYVFGGARGVDSDALQHISRTQPGSQRTVVVPNRLRDQPLSTRSITRQNATRVIELKNSSLGRFQARNRFMVDRSTHVRAFYDFRGRGGTFNTIQYARSKGKNISIQPMNRFDKNVILRKSPNAFRGWFNEMRSMKVDLSAVKMIILEFIKTILQTTVRLFIEGLGYAGVKTLEALWRL